MFVAPSGRGSASSPPTIWNRRSTARLTPDDLFDIAIRHGLHFDQTRQIGIVFHMLATLAENGRIGATAVGNSPDDADRLLARLQAALEDEASARSSPASCLRGSLAAAGLGKRMAGQKSA